MLAFIVFPIAALLAYLLGAIPTGYIVARLWKLDDIRNAGSGNVGATNVYRVAGKLPGFITLLADIAKGVAAVAIVASYSYRFVPDVDYDFYRSFLGFIAVAGHIWPVFLNFKGGKGVATTIGILIVLAPKSLVLSLLVWVAVFSLCNFVSLASLAFGVALPIFSISTGNSIYITLLAVIICVINTYKHKSNISRLSKGVENKTFIFKKR